MDNLAHIIREKRILNKLSQTQLASLIKRSPQLICDIEAGRKNPGRDTLIHIAKILDLSVDQIFLS